MDNGTSCYRRFCDGDESGLEELIRDYKDGLIWYLYSFVGDITVAEELAEDTFVLLGTKKPRDKGTGSFKTWLYTIGRHVAIDHLRRLARRREVPLDDCPELPTAADEPESRYVRAEQQAAVRRALACLRSEYRQALWLVYYEDFTHAEVAAVMKKRVHAVDMLLSRARKSLKTQLESEGFVYENL